MDYTLVMPDEEIDKKHYFMNIDHIEPIPSMIELFNKVKTNHPTMILTTRHPDLKDEIKERFDCNVECRNFCLTPDEIFKELETNENFESFIS